MHWVIGGEIHNHNLANVYVDCLAQRSGSGMSLCVISSPVNHSVEVIRFVFNSLALHLRLRMLLLCIPGPLQTSSNFLVSVFMCIWAAPKRGLKCACWLDLIWFESKMADQHWSFLSVLMSNYWLPLPPLTYYVSGKQSRQLPCDFKDFCAGISDVNGLWKRVFAKNHGGINPCFLDGAWKHCGNLPYIAYIAPYVHTYIGTYVVGWTHLFCGVS